MKEEILGNWPANCLQRAFAEGAAWWQFHAHGSTMFTSERNEAEAEAVRRYGVPGDDGVVQKLRRVANAFAYLVRTESLGDAFNIGDNQFDRHWLAIECAERNGREEPNEDDEFEGALLMLETAMRAEKAAEGEFYEN